MSGDTGNVTSGGPPRRPPILDRLERKPQALRRRFVRGLGITGVVLGILVLLALVVLARSYLESRWTLPETSITARVEEDLYYNINFESKSASRASNINYTTDELIHIGNPRGGVEGVLARVERNQTDNRFNYQLKNERDILVATDSRVQVANRPFIDKTAIVSTMETGFLIDPATGARSRQHSLYALEGPRLHARATTTIAHQADGPRLINTLFEYSEWWGLFGNRARSGTELVEYGRKTPAELIERFTGRHREWHDRQNMRMTNPLSGDLKSLRKHSRPLFRSDEGLPGPWWQLDLLPQGSTIHLYTTADRSRSRRIRISWDKTGVFPWRWLNGGYDARDDVGELFRVKIRDYWFHFRNQLAYLYFLDLNGDGRIDRDTELIGQVFYKSAGSPLGERDDTVPEGPLTGENTSEFTRNKTFVFRVGADPERADTDFLLCDAIEKLLPDAILKGYARDSHLAYIERVRDDDILARHTTRASLHNAVTELDMLDWKRGVIDLLRAAKRDYATELSAYYFGDLDFPGPEPLTRDPEPGWIVPPGR